MSRGLPTRASRHHGDDGAGAFRCSSAARVRVRVCVYGDTPQYQSMTFKTTSVRKVLTDPAAVLAAAEVAPVMIGPASNPTHVMLSAESHIDLLAAAAVLANAITCLPKKQRVPLLAYGLVSSYPELDHLAKSELRQLAKQVDKTLASYVAGAAPEPGILATVWPAEQ